MSKKHNKKPKTKKKKLKITADFRHEEQEVAELIESSRSTSEVQETIDNEEESIQFFTSTLEEKSPDSEATFSVKSSFDSIPEVKFQTPKKIVPWEPQTICFNDNLLTTDGRVTPPDPKSNRQLPESSADEKLPTEFFYFNKKTLELTEEPPNRFLLKVLLDDLVFTSHPLQTEEHKLAISLETLVDEYIRRLESKTIEKLRLELETLRNLVKHKEDANFMIQLKETRESLHSEEKLIKDLLKNMLDKWLTLKQVRKTQGFQYTTLKLQLKVRPYDEEKRVNEYNERFERELKEVYQESLRLYYEEKKSSRAKVHKPKVQVIKEEFETIYRESVPDPCEPDLEIIRSYTTDTPKRLTQFKKYFLKVYLNKNLVSSTQPMWMSSQFSLDIRETFGILLYDNKPNEIRVELYDMGHIFSSKVGYILVPIQEDHRPRAEWTFSSEDVSGYINISVECSSGSQQEKTHIPTAPFTDIERKKSPSQDQESEDLNFCSEEEIENNLRFNLLISRYNKDAKFKDKKFIPANEYEIEENIDEIEVLEKMELIDPIDCLKYKGKKFVKSLYNDLEEHCKDVCKYSEEYWLDNNEPFTFRSFINSLVSSLWGNGDDNLNSNMIKHNGQEFHHFKINAHIGRASGIPNRILQTDVTDKSSFNASSYFLAQNVKTANVKPYVSISYKKNLVRGKTSEGSNPFWNEPLDLEIVESPVGLNDDIRIEIFDEYVENIINEDYTRSMEVYQRIYSNWLGEYRLPISTLLKHKVINGVFEIKCPKLLAGYSTAQGDHVEIPIDHSSDGVSSCLLWITLSISPLVDVPQTNTFCIVSTEPTDVTKHIKKWSADVKQLYPKRYVDPLICTEDGERVCITRTLDGIPLPIDIAENLMTLCRRYVSLIGVVKPTFNPMVGFDGVWLNNSRVLEGNIGSPKDLGTLLASYMVNIGISCWVVLGIGYPHFDGAYVLYNEEDEFYFIDPCSGHIYSTNDVVCPLTQIKCVYNQYNFYCNIQRENRVAFTNFNFGDSSCWLPLFNRRIFAPLSGGFHEKDYVYRDPLKTSNIQKNIERKIMKKISSWRSMRKTVWNRGFHGILFNILRNLEADTTYNLPPENYLDQLQQDFPSYKIFGFTLNFPYTNLSAISDRIKSTGIHLNMSKEVEFALAVYIHSYPNNIMSVWIFLISIVPYKSIQI